MGLADFIALHAGKFVYNVNRPPTPAQCVDLAEAWCDYLGIERFGGNAADFQFDAHPDCDWVANTPTNVPAEGDIVIWRSTPTDLPGHVDIFKAGDANQFTGFDQNWPFNSPAHIQSHTYQGVAGWMHPRPKVAPAPVVMTPDPNLLPLVTPPPPPTPEETQDSILRNLVVRVTGLENRLDVDVTFINDLVQQVAAIQATVVALKAGSAPAPTGDAFLRVTTGTDPRGSIQYLTLYDQTGAAITDFVAKDASDLVNGDHPIIRKDSMGNLIISPLGGHSLILGGDNGDGNIGNSSFFQRGSLNATSAGSWTVTLPYPVADTNYRVFVTPHVHGIVKSVDKFVVTVDVTDTYDWLVIRG